MKRVLVYYYSQTGQLASIVHEFNRSFIDAGWMVDVEEIKPLQPYTFPWSADSFFHEMPESVLGITTELQPLQVDFSVQYDLIVLAYQPWYLSPSIPITSLLNHSQVKKQLDGAKVVTLIGARNMWLNAQEKIKALLPSGTQLIGNIAFIDRHQNHISALTILYWMLTGKKERCFNVLPLPGISQKDIKSATGFGQIVVNAIENKQDKELQNQIVQAKGVEVDADIMFIEHRAPRLFSIWANLIIKKKNRLFWERAFKYYLIVALFIVAPIILLINRFFFRPLFIKQVRNKKKYYLGIQ
jgi:hypothetical protein